MKTNRGQRLNGILNDLPSIMPPLGNLPSIMPPLGLTPRSPQVTPQGPRDLKQPASSVVLNNAPRAMRQPKGAA